MSFGFAVGVRVFHGLWDVRRAALGVEWGWGGSGGIGQGT